MSVNIYNKAQDKLINVSGSSSISTKDENGLEVIADAGEEGLYVHLPFDFKYDADTDEYGYIDKDGTFNPFSAGIDFIAPEFDAETPYEKGDYCMYDGILRVKTSDTRSRSLWNPADWRIEKLSDLFAGGGGNSNLIVDNTNPYLYRYSLITGGSGYVGGVLYFQNNIYTKVTVTTPSTIVSIATSDDGSTWTTVANNVKTANIAGKKYIKISISMANATGSEINSLKWE